MMKTITVKATTKPTGENPNPESTLIHLEKNHPGIAEKLNIHFDVADEHILFVNQITCITPYRRGGSIIRLSCGFEFYTKEESDNLIEQINS